MVRSVLRSRCVRISLLGLLAMGGGCAQTVSVRVDRPTRVTFDGEDLGVVTPEEPVEVEVAPGIDDVPYGIEVGGQQFTGTVERGSLSPLLTIAGVTGACCAVPTCVAAGLCATNPTLLSAPVCGLVCAFGGVFNALEALYGCAAQFCLSPGWLTAPAAAAGLAAGASPLLLLGFRTVPSALMLTPGGAFDVAAWEQRRERPAPARLASGEVAY
jgi:hypothetical protein